MKTAFTNDLSEGLFEKVFIVFEDLYDPELHREVGKLCKENGIRSDFITTKEQAIKMRTEYRSLETGVFFIKESLVEGLILSSKLTLMFAPSSLVVISTT